MSVERVHGQVGRAAARGVCRRAKLAAKSCPSRHLYKTLPAEASIVCAVPVVALYLIFQRYLVGGLTAGSVK